MASNKYNLREQSKNRYYFTHKTQNWAKKIGVKMFAMFKTFFRRQIFGARYFGGLVITVEVWKKIKNRERQILIATIKKFHLNLCRSGGMFAFRR